ncbi:hypothetical protein CYMTET_54591 [Cymbomonas tetramitiformis]|uniref:Uncharacterized protein n=1 Tax=Cymbomonas tetramitiformis TaxID=36881 RepID=A0AAE0BG11_9CHLO|nr:hypothetical protein CYMTET_54591 [Cymbomonas tetramitiformis]
MEEDVGGKEEVDEEEDTAHGGSLGWKERRLRQLSFALGRGVADTVIRRAPGRCQRGDDWRWSGGRCRGEADDPGPAQARAESVEEVLAPMDRGWEVIDEMGFATQSAGSRRVGGAELRRHAIATSFWAFGGGKGGGGRRHRPADMWEDRWAAP